MLLVLERSPTNVPGGTGAEAAGAGRGSEAEDAARLVLFKAEKLQGLTYYNEGYRTPPSSYPAGSTGQDRTGQSKALLLQDPLRLIDFDRRSDSTAASYSDS